MTTYQTNYVGYGSRRVGPTQGDKDVASNIGWSEIVYDYIEDPVFTSTLNPTNSAIPAGHPFTG